MIDKRLVQLQKHNQGKIFLVVLTRVGNLCLSLIFYFSIATLIQQLAAQAVTSKELFTLTGVTILIALAKISLTRLGSLTAFAASAELRLTIREKVMAKVFRLGPAAQNHVATSELTQIAVDGIEQLEVYYSQFIPQFFYSLIAALLIFASLAAYQLKAALVLLMCVPLIPISIMLIMKIAKRVLHSYWGEYLNLGELFYENIQGLTTLKIYQQDEKRHQQMNQTAESFRQATMRLLTMQLNSITVMDIIAYAGAGIGIALALIAFQQGNLSLVGMIMFILLSAEFFIPLRQLGSLFHVAMTGISASERLFDFLEIPEQAPLDQSTGFSQVPQEINLENLSYTYPGENKLALEELTLSFKRGEFNAIIGKSGSGKSTLGMILAGLYSDYSGTLKWNDTPLSTINQESIFNQVEMVSNKGFLFAKTIRENLLLGRKDVSETNLWAVLEHVNLADFVKSLPNQLDYPLIEEGKNLSGGQKQRLLLARSLLQDKEIYIFDEITSSIDLASETKIMAHLNTLAQEKIVIFISHRLYNILTADQVTVFDSGKLVESGSPAHLQAHSTYFADYLQTEQQLLGEEFYQ